MTQPRVALMLWLPDGAGRQAAAVRSYGEQPLPSHNPRERMPVTRRLEPRLSASAFQVRYDARYDESGNGRGPAGGAS